MAKLATRSREAAKRKAAELTPEERNVALASGRGAVHLRNTGMANNHVAYPACRAAVSGARTSRYTHTAAAVNCEKCIEIVQADRGARAARENGRSPRASRSQRNGARQEVANVKATEIIAEETAKVLAKRGTHVEMNEQRKDGCSDEDYKLAVRVRELRASGLSWWKIGYELQLPGSGPSVKQGKTGAAHARRLWEKAWGKTYADTSAPRETKAVKAERARTQPGRPYFDKDATDDFIALSVPGHTIEWVARVGNDPASAVHTVLSATVSGLHPIEVVQGPKGRVLKFYELPEPGSRVSGPLRSVYVDRIEKVSL